MNTMEANKLNSPYNTAHNTPGNTPDNSPKRFINPQIFSHFVQQTSPPPQSNSSAMSLHSDSIEEGCKVAGDFLSNGHFDRAIELLQKLTLSGTPETKEANYQLGLALKNGSSGQQDLQGASECFRKAYLQGHLGATYQYGKMMFEGYQNREGMYVQNVQIARQCFEQICNNHSESSNSSQSETTKSKGYEDVTDLMEQDDEEISSYFTSSSAGNQKTEQEVFELANSHLFLADIYDLGLGTPRNGDSAVYHLKQAHHLKISEATYRLGCKYFTGSDVAISYWNANILFFTYTEEPPNPNEMDEVEFYRNACFSLGYMANTGYGTKKSEHTAHTYFLKAAHYKHPLASFYLARNYFEGSGVGQDIPKAQALFEQVIPFLVQEVNQHPCVDYYLCLGQYYECGYGLSPNPSKASHFYSKAAQLGSVEAAFKCGTMLYHANGITRNYSTALQFFSFAHKNGHPQAQAYIQKINVLLEKQTTTTTLGASQQSGLEQQRDPSRFSNAAPSILGPNNMMSN